MFSLQQNQRRREWNPPSSGFYPEVEGRRLEMAQTMYTHISKCKSDKIKRKKI
jgi:hypothetical protein